MDDPRFKRVTTDPRFKSIPKKSRKVTIDSRFQSMFTGDQFKVKYNVDKRGRKVNQTSSEDLRKYYDLEEDPSDSGVKKELARKEKLVESIRKEEIDEENDEEVTSAEEVWSGAGSSEEESSDEDFSGDQDSATEAIELWREEEDNVPMSDKTSQRLAVCNMDWDYLDAKDIYVLLSSFKPTGSSIRSVTVYPSDFGLERIAHEEIQGPVELVDTAEETLGSKSRPSGEGTGYSKEKLRQYQLNRLKYYYGIVECDTIATAQHIYEQCNGLEYEHCGGQMDLRFIPEGTAFEERKAKSVATESSVMSENYTPPDFICSALQQSKVKLSWDETDPRRVTLLQKKFTKDDMQMMDFNAYLASSSSSNSEGEEDTKGNNTQAYKALLHEEEKSEDSDDVAEEMQVSWGQGLKDTAEDLVKKKDQEKANGMKVESSWEKYLQKRKEKRKEAKRKKVVPQDSHEGVEGVGAQQGDSGFDDPFFQHDVTMATARAVNTKKRKKKELTEEDIKEKEELELLMLSEEEDVSHQHFKFSSIVRSEKDSSKRKRRKRKHEDEKETPQVDNFKVDLVDPRFNDLYESHIYAPDPSVPQYRATKGMAAIMEERRQRVKKKLTKKSLEFTGQADQPATNTDSSLQLLVKSVKGKTALFKAHRRKPTVKTTKGKIKRKN